MRPKEPKSKERTPQTQSVQRSAELHVENYAKNELETSTQHVQAALHANVNKNLKASSQDVLTNIITNPKKNLRFVLQVTPLPFRDQYA
jgi:hypothetical protein